MKKTALISVYNKTGIETFARDLETAGWTLYASGGTAQYLRDQNVSVLDTSDLVGGGAILGHRVVTLSREIYAGLLATHSKEDQAEMKRLGIPYIDLICVDLYPIKDAIGKPDASETSVIELTDIGGPTLLRAAAKGRRIVVSHASQRETVIKWLNDNQPDKELFLRGLAAAAEAEVAAYALASARYSGDDAYDGVIGSRIATAKYGENPWQTQASLYKTLADSDPLALHAFLQVQGASPSYNNYADIDRLLQTITHIAAGFDVNKLTKPCIALGAKHGNVCGAAVGTDPADTTRRMLDGDLRAIFGGVMMLNFPIDETIADILLTYKVEKGRRLIDGVVAPSVTAKAKELLSRKGDKCRILTNTALQKLDQSSLDNNRRLRYVRGGFIMQDNYTYVLDLSAAQSSSTRKLTPENKRDCVLGWAIGSTSNSNTITLIKDGMLIGNGVGQQDRVSAAELAIKRAKDAEHQTHGAFAYSDSFFPFPDGPQRLADAGITSIFASSGSVGDNAVLEACKKANVNLITLPDVQVRGFYAH